MLKTYGTLVLEVVLLVDFLELGAQVIHGIGGDKQLHQL